METDHGSDFSSIDDSRTNAFVLLFNVWTYTDMKVKVLKAFHLDLDSLSEHDRKWIKGAQITELSNDCVTLGVNSRKWYSDTFKSVITAKRTFGRHFAPGAKWIEISEEERKMWNEG